MRFLDVGCGFGGLLVRLSPLFPDTLHAGAWSCATRRAPQPHLAAHFAEQLYVMIP